MEAKTVNRRGEIDTRPPFRSVKDAVSLFATGIVNGEVDPQKLKQVSPDEGSDSDNTTIKHLEDIKQSLEKTMEQTGLMATQMCSLKTELEEAKRELRQLKESKVEGIEELKFIEEPPKPEDDYHERKEDYSEAEVEKKRGKPNVSFKHPTLSQIVSPHTKREKKMAELGLWEEEESQVRSKKNKEGFTLVKLIGGILLHKRKTNHRV